MKIIQVCFALSVFSCSLLAEIPIKKEGRLLGILTAKGEAWVQIKEDGGMVSRYLIPWQGGSPARGGGFNSNSIKKLKNLVVGNRVSLDWYWDGHLRVKKINVLKPSKKSGIFNGILVKKGPWWIDVESEEDQTPWRFYPRWVGGLPKDGGRYNPYLVDFFDNFKINDPVRFAWSYDFRPRIDKFVEQEKDDFFVPFYEGKIDPNLSPSSSTPVISPVVNPFDQLTPSPPVNPFDQIPVKQNPFDQINSKTNPFEQVSPNKENPFDAINEKTLNPFEKVDQKMMKNKSGTPANPFENIPDTMPKEANPFENAPLPGNPFEGVPQ